MENTIKTINVDMSVRKVPEDNDNKKQINMVKEPKKRTITSQDCWNFTEEELFLENQVNYIIQLCNNEVIDTELCSLINKNIVQKINGYKSQDIKKKLYTPELLIDREHVLDLLKCSQHICYYCKELVIILYENVREPKQWSLDRIDNKIGHNKGNIVIACLECNLNRKTMYHERYAFTKQLTIVKQK
jgi:hypothetical protein